MSAKVFNLVIASAPRRSGRNASTDLVGVVVGRGHLDRGGQVEDDGSLLVTILSLEPSIHHRLAELDRKLGLGLTERLGTVLELPLRLVPTRDRLVHEFADQRNVLHGELNGLLLGVVEHLIAEDGRGGVVHVENDFVGIADGLKSALDELLARGRKDLNCISTGEHRGKGTDLQPDVLGELLLLNQASNEPEFGLGRRGEARLNLLEAALEEELEEDGLLLDGHWIHERLVPVAQVGRGPTGRLGDALVGPLTVLERHRHERPRTVSWDEQRGTDLYFVDGSASHEA